MFVLIEFASVKNSFHALVTKPNTIYKCISSLDGVALFREYLHRGVIVSFYNQYMYLNRLKTFLFTSAFKLCNAPLVTIGVSGALETAHLYLYLYLNLYVDCTNAFALYSTSVRALMHVNELNAVLQYDLHRYITVYALHH